MMTFDLAPTARIYKVGGAVRDTLLNYPHSETDWVVVGATPEALLASGFKQVGADFPVFLHPETGGNSPWRERSVSQVRVTTALRFMLTHR